MTTAEIIAIGTELLLGEIQDTNTSYLARNLRDAGIHLYRTMIVGDNIGRIAQAIQEALGRAEIVITTGGLGPTVDDPTRAAVAQAVGVDLEFRAELWEQIEERFRRWGRHATDNNRRQAFIPAGAQAIENPVGTAPAFAVNDGERVIISLPGVPREMEYLWANAVLPYLKTRFELQEIIRARILHTAGVGESQVDEWIGDLELSPNPTVGLAAHPGQIDIRITARGSSAEEIEILIQDMETEIRRRVGESIYGVNQETLESLLISHLAATGMRLLTVECGLNGALAHRLKRAPGSDERVMAVTDWCEPGSLAQTCGALREELGVELALGAALIAQERQQDLSLVLITPEGTTELQRSYGGPPQNGVSWAVHTALDFARRTLIRNRAI